MARNRKKKTKEEEKVVEPEPEPEKPLHWWEISDEAGYDRNTEVKRIYNEFLEKQAAPKKATDSTTRKKRLRM